MAGCDILAAENVNGKCPYLAPLPYRGRRNEPAHVIEVVRKLAEIRGITPEEAGRVTAANARRMFGIGNG